MLAEFVFVKELTLDVQNTIAPPKQKLTSAVNTKAVNTEPVNTEAVNTDSPTFAASPKSDDKSEKPQTTTNEQGIGNGSAYDKIEDGSVKSAPNSPFAGSAIGSPHGDFADSDFRKTAGEDSSPRDHTIQETQRLVFKIFTPVSQMLANCPFYHMITRCTLIVLIIHIRCAFERSWFYYSYYYFYLKGSSYYRSNSW